MYVASSERKFIWIPSTIVSGSVSNGTKKKKKTVPYESEGPGDKLIILDLYKKKKKTNVYLSRILNPKPAHENLFIF